jgi:hypothetical protein
MKIADYTWNWCDECGAHRMPSVALDCGVAICHPCLLKALSLVEHDARPAPAAPSEQASEPLPDEALWGDEQAGSEGKDLRGPF